MQEKSNKLCTLFLVVPCYNEKEVLIQSAEQLKIKMNNMLENGIISKESKIVFVDDGSKDDTWSIIKNLNNNDTIFQGIKLSRNRGHQNAVLAGLMTVKSSCDICITLDADLQDDIDVLDKFVEKYYKGCDIVYGVREDRQSDSFFKRSTAQGFYKFMKCMGVECIYNHADYRLMSRRAMDALEDFKEVNLFLRGLVPLVGYKSDKVLFSRKKRLAGTSKYPLSKMLSLAGDGITSLSIKPIRVILVTGFVIFLVSLLTLFGLFVSSFLGNVMAKWDAMIVSLWALGGLQLTALGVVGEYIGKAYMETKRRPRFIIEDYVK